jgi:hypothetical protein
MDLQEVGCESIDWIAVQEEVMGTSECSNEPLGSIKCGEFLD